MEIHLPKIDVTFYLLKGKSEEELARGKMYHAPAIGESIWLSSFDQERRHYIVTKVAHWVFVARNADQHSVAVYVKADK